MPEMVSMHSFPYEIYVVFIWIWDVFIPSREGGILLERDGIPAKADKNLHINASPRDDFETVLLCD